MCGICIPKKSHNYHHHRLIEAMTNAQVVRDIDNEVPDVFPQLIEEIETLLRNMTKKGARMMARY